MATGQNLKKGGQWLSFQEPHLARHPPLHLRSASIMITTMIIIVIIIIIGVVVITMINHNDLSKADSAGHP